MTTVSIAEAYDREGGIDADGRGKREAKLVQRRVNYCDSKYGFSWSLTMRDTNYYP